MKIEMRDIEVFIKEKNKKIHYGNMTFDKGDFVHIKGRNGIGKSTFLKLFYNNFDYIKATGELNFYGIGTGHDHKDVLKYEGYNEHFDSILSVDQEFKYPKFINSVYKYLFYEISIKFKERGKDIYKDKNLFNKIEIAIEKYVSKDLNFLISNQKHKVLKKRLNTKISRLSGGQQKMLQFLNTILLLELTLEENNILLLDEPLNSLDAQNKMVLNNLVQTMLNSNNNLTVFLISHCNAFLGINKIIEITPKSSLDLIQTFEAKLTIISKNHSTVSTSAKRCWPSILCWLWFSG
jgi:ABC-type nitrate/sulfonate/bicarbonate transport system ATPase subunit